MSKHTEGPWRVGVTEDSACRIYADEYPDHAIARTYGQDLNGIGICQLTGPQNRADARLIAAAPELLAALADCVAHMHWTQPLGEAALKKAKAAIAKATGSEA